MEMKMANARMMMLDGPTGNVTVLAEEDDDNKFWEVVYMTVDIVLGIVVMAQIVMTIVYYCRTRDMDEVTRLTKIIMVMASLSGLILDALWIG